MLLDLSAFSFFQKNTLIDDKLNRIYPKVDNFKTRIYCEKWVFEMYKAFAFPNTQAVESEWVFNIADFVEMQDAVEIWIFIFQDLRQNRKMDAG